MTICPTILESLTLVPERPPVFKALRSPLRQQNLRVAEIVFQLGREAKIKVPRLQASRSQGSRTLSIGTIVNPFAGPLVNSGGPADVCAVGDAASGFAALNEILFRAEAPTPHRAAASLSTAIWDLIWTDSQRESQRVFMEMVF